MALSRRRDGPNARDHAIVVGINKYKEHDDYDDLRGAVNDAVDFAKWLVDPKYGNLRPDQVDVLLSEKKQVPKGVRLDLCPEKHRIERTMKRLIKNLVDHQVQGRHLYIFFAGHGAGDELRGAVLLAADHARDMDCYVHGKKSADSFYRAALFEKVFLFMDCCRDRDDELTVQDSPFRVRNDSRMDQVEWCYAFGTKYDNKSYERKFGRSFHGIFSRALLAGLKGGAAKESTVTAAELREFVRKRIKEMGEDEQKPDFEFDPPEMVVLGGVQPQTVPVSVTLSPPNKEFEIRDGRNYAQVYEVERQKLGRNRWQVNLPSGRLWVFSIPLVGGGAITKSLNVKDRMLAGEEDNRVVF